MCLCFSGSFLPRLQGREKPALEASLNSHGKHSRANRDDDRLRQGGVFFGGPVGGGCPPGKNDVRKKAPGRQVGSGTALFSSTEQGGSGPMPILKHPTGLRNCRAQPLKTRTY